MAADAGGQNACGPHQGLERVVREDGPGLICEVEPGTATVSLRTRPDQIALSDQALSRLRSRATGRTMEIREGRGRSREAVGACEVAQRRPLRRCQAGDEAVAVGNSGEVGELCLRRENVVREYWRRPGLLEESMIDDWFRTGDLASVDDQGYVYLKGRKKDMIIVGGENVYALEVENTLLAHDDILDAAVVGIEATGIATYLGELIRAVVVAEPGAQLAERDVKRHCAERLATFKIPHQVEFRDELPRNPSGKVLKEELK